MIGKLAFYLLLVLLLFSVLAECKRRKKQQPPEQGTNILSFLGLFTLRMIYGFATMLGFEEYLQEFMGGILVPPGVDVDDYRDYGDDDY